MPAPDKYTGSNRTEAFDRAFAITPHDTNDLPAMTRAVWVGGDGNISVVLAGMDTPVTLTGAKAGTLIPMEATIIRSTGTTATALVGVY